MNYRFLMETDAIWAETWKEESCYWNLLWKGLNRLRLANLFCDLILVSADNVEFSVHSVVMAAVSEVCNITVKINKIFRRSEDTCGCDCLLTSEIHLILMIH